MTFYTITETLTRVVEINNKEIIPNKLNYAKKNGIMIIAKCSEKLSDKREIELLKGYNNLK